MAGQEGGSQARPRIGFNLIGFCGETLLYWQMINLRQVGGLSRGRRSPGSPQPWPTQLCILLYQPLQFNPGLGPSGGERTLSGTWTPLLSPPLPALSLVPSSLTSVLALMGDQTWCFFCKVWLSGVEEG